MDLVCSGAISEPAHFSGNTNAPFCQAWHDWRTSKRKGEQCSHKIYHEKKETHRESGDFPFATKTGNQRRVDARGADNRSVFRACVFFFGQMVMGQKAQGAAREKNRVVFFGMYMALPFRILIRKKIHNRTKWQDSKKKERKDAKRGFRTKKGHRGKKLWPSQYDARGMHAFI